MGSGYRALIVLVICCAMALAPPLVHSAQSGASPTNDDLADRLVRLEEQVRTLAESIAVASVDGDAASLRHELRQEFEYYIDRLDAERSQFRSFLETLIKWFAGFLTAVICVVGWRCVRDAKVFVDSQARLLVSKILDERVGTLEDRLAAYDRVATRELWFRKSNVLVTGSTDLHDEMREALDVMKEEISLDVVPYSEATFLSKSTGKQYSLVIYE